MKSRSIIGIISLLLVSLLVIGCIDSDKKGNVTEPITVSTTVLSTTTPIVTTENTGPITEDTVMPITTTTEEQNVANIEIYNGVANSEFLAYTFKVNDEKVILDRNVRLLNLATEEGSAIIKVDGDSYKLVDNIEQEIKDRIIKIVDLDGTNQTVKVMIKYIT